MWAWVLECLAAILFKMASLLDLTLEEIGLSGLEGKRERGSLKESLLTSLSLGCTPTQLWGHLSAHTPPLSLDLSSSSVREYVWSQILTFTKMVQIYKSPSPIPSQEPFSKYKVNNNNYYYYSRHVYSNFLYDHDHYNFFS